MWSNDMDPTVGSQGPPYYSPYLTQTQQQLRMQATCVAGCYDASTAFLGYLDDLRIYDYAMSSREIGFVNSDTVRNGLNCLYRTILDASGLVVKGCSHYIDEILNRGLTLYFPFDDPWSYYNARSDSSGMVSGKINYASREYAQVTICILDVTDH